MQKQPVSVLDENNESIKNNGGNEQRFVKLTFGWEFHYEIDNEWYCFLPRFCV